VQACGQDIAIVGVGPGQSAAWCLLVRPLALSCPTCGYPSLNGMLASSARQGLGKSGTHKKRTQARRSTGDDHTSKHVDSIARALTGSQHGLHGTLTGLPRAGSLKNEEGGGEASKGTVARSSTLRGPEGARSGGVFPERRSSEAGRRSIFQQAARFSIANPTCPSFSCFQFA